MTAEPGLQSQPPRESELAVRSLLIPLDGMALLVPNALVSEVATLSEIKPVSVGIPAMLGSIRWRGLQLPLLSFERVIGNKLGMPVRNSRAIILNTLNGNREMPFIAVLSQRIPRLLLVTGRMLQRTSDAPPQEAVLATLELQGDEVLVPDVDRLEQLLRQRGVKVERVID
jgi:chemosensory pili system protein ChpC